MNNKHLAQISIILLVVVGLVACNQPASQGPGTVATQGTVFPTPKVTSDLSNFDRAGTQTAVAEQAAAKPTETPVPPTPTAEAPLLAVTETPVPAPAQPTATLVPTLNVAIPTIAVPANYTLQEGEYPYCIARRFNVDPGEMLRVNGLSGDTYYAGLVLKIPQTGGGFPAERALKKHPATYTVKTGDTIYDIACQYGDVDPAQIAAANGLTVPYSLKVGQQINIP